MTPQDTLDFLERLSGVGGELPQDEAWIFCGFRGDPSSVDHRAWRPHVWRPGMPLPINPLHTNGYLTISTFRQNERNEWRRRTDLFSELRVLMIDDVGFGDSPSNRVDYKTVSALPPTLAIESSPNNYQFLYVLSKPEWRVERAAMLIKAFIAQKLLGDDPGMAGVNRVFRLPGFVNGKDKYGGWRVKQSERLSSGAVYTSDELVKGFGLTLRQLARPARVSPGIHKERLETFKLWKRVMLALDIVQRKQGNMAGWTPITCPWIDEHSGRADTGTAVRDPAPENEWHGAFRCHHGHCQDKTWGQFTDKLALAVAEEIDSANSTYQEIDQ